LITPPLKGFDVLCGKHEPFASLSLFSKPTMPILLNSLGIVGFDHMDDIRLAR
jgi:hypothetical protein